MAHALTKEQLENLFWKVTMILLDLDPESTSQAVQKHVRISWPESDDGNSTWERNENTVFLRISPVQDDYNLYETDYKYNLQSDSLTEVVDYHRCFSINWVCYGPGSLEEADKIRAGIFRQDIRLLLRKNKLAFIPKVREPVRIPELDESGQWWERYDLTVNFYALTQHEFGSGMIETAPDVTIYY